MEQDENIKEVTDMKTYVISDKISENNHLFNTYNLTREQWSWCFIVVSIFLSSHVNAIVEISQLN